MGSEEILPAKPLDVITNALYICDTVIHVAKTGITILAALRSIYFFIKI